MAKKDKSIDQEIMDHINDVKKLDSTLVQLLKDGSQSLNGSNRTEEINTIINQYNELINKDAYNFTKNKTISQSNYTYMANMLVGKPLNPSDKKNAKKMAENDFANRLRLEELFSNGDMNVAGYFLAQSSNTYRIMDEIESVCAFMYQLDEAINVLRDNIMNSEQSLTDLPFDITFEGVDPQKSAEYIKTVTDAFTPDLKVKLNDHIIPKSLKFGKYYVMTIPYSEIGVKMIDKSVNKTRSLFNIGSGQGIGLESTEEIDTGFDSCMESVSTIMDNVYEDYKDSLSKYGSKETIVESIKYNLENILISEEATPPNITGITEAAYDQMPDDL